MTSKPLGSSNHYCADNDDVLGTADATALAAEIGAGHISAAEAMDAAIARVQRADPVLHAIACERFDAARQEAAQVNVKPGDATPFAGVPSVIKDNTDLAGLPTVHGSRAVKPRAAKADAAFARQFMATGLIPLAKTRLPEFGLTATTEYVADEPVHNPWNLAHSAGGSSGGSAALVASGALPIAHANDGGGSIRIPAACCGLVGLKVSRGRIVDHALAKNLPINLIADGVVSRSVRDTAHFFAGAEHYYRNRKLPALGLVEGPGKRRLRIGFYTELPNGQAADSECVAAVHQAAGLCEELGHSVEQTASPLTARMVDHFMLYYGLMSGGLTWGGRWLVGPGFDQSKLDPLTRQFATYFRRNLHHMPAAMLSLRRAGQAVARQHERYDLLLTPTLGHPPPELGWLRPDLPFEQAWERLPAFAGFTPLANALGTPSITLPLARNAGGLPIGVQFGAPAGDEHNLLELAYGLEQASSQLAGVAAFTSRPR